MSTRKEVSHRWYMQNRERILARQKEKRKQDGGAERRSIERESQARIKLRYPLLKTVKDIKYRAREKGLEYDLDDEWAKEKDTGVCALSGVPYYVNTGGATFSSYSPSIDRIDNSRGYTKDNCRVVLMCINAFKHTMSDEEMFNIINAMLNKHRLQQTPS